MSGIAVWDLSGTNPSLYANRYPKKNPFIPELAESIYFFVYYDGFKNFAFSIPFYDYKPNYQTLFYADRSLAVRFFVFTQSTELNNEGFYLMDYQKRPFHIKDELRND